MKLKDFVNGVIAAAWLVEMLMVNIFIVKCIGANNLSTFVTYDSKNFKVWLIIWSIVLVLLHVIKLALFFIKKEEK